jgi:hypothetical protein
LPARRLCFILFALAALALPAAAAEKAPPPNDNRANAQALDQPPVTVSGTTVGATHDAKDPSPFCATVDATVWYQLNAETTQRLVLRLTAAGDLDAVVAVYELRRSRLIQQACDVTDDNGKAALSFNEQSGATYLILVGSLPSSVDGNFRFTLFPPEPLSTPPGTPLPRHGVKSTVDPLVDFDDAWSVALKPGATYRVNLVPLGDHCVSLALYRPGTRSFSGTRPFHYFGCGGYLLLTPRPEEAGRYSLLVSATGTRSVVERYRLQVVPAGPDDTAPGIPIENRQTRRGSLSGRGVDVVDLYRFSLRDKSDVRLRLRTRETRSFDLLLVRENGRRLECACGESGSVEIELQLFPGRYYVAVRSRRFSGGRYALALLSRTITSTELLISGTRHATAQPGQSVVISVAVAHTSAGRVNVEVDRFDPLAGWQFARLFRTRVDAAGRAQISWLPPSQGRWRASAVYFGTIVASPSRSAAATLVVAPPL